MILWTHRKSDWCISLENSEVLRIYKYIIVALMPGHTVSIVAVGSSE